MYRFLLLISAFSCLANAGTLFLPAYPAKVLVFDEGKGQIVDRIPLVTGTPMSIRLSPDRKLIYLTTIDHNGIEVIDVATHKVVNHFVLNTPDKQYRFWGGAPDPNGKFFYTVSKEIDQKPDHYDVGKPMYTVIDLEQKKIVKTVEVPKEDATARNLDYAGGSFQLSPDGKYLYRFGESISVLQPSDFKEIDKIDLSKPEFPGMQNVRFGGGFGGDLDLMNEPGQHMALFNSEDPVVHNKVFGLGRFDLSTRQMEFNPIGPAPGGMAGFQVTPDKKRAYTVAVNGIHGTKHCEFWAFDLDSDQISKKAEVPCRTRFTLGISTNGKKLYIYGAGFDIEVYDAATLKYEKTYDLNNDVTYGGIVALP
jgi:DNA-binding beta-propeller fold protein YncE